MNPYAFELGRKKELCLAELLSLFGEDNLVEKNNDTAVFKLDNVNLPPDTQALQDRLGGTIRIIEIMEQVPEKEQIPKAIGRLLRGNFSYAKGKINFAISGFGFKNLADLKVKELLSEAKQIFKSLHFNARFVNKDTFKNPPPSTIYKARILEKGVDICIIKREKGYYIGATVAIQDIDSYSERDFKKPFRNPKIGMLPPKLAQTMINLALPGMPKEAVIFDPFCGTGTVLMEGLLMDYDVMGSDINKELVTATEKNCEWLRRRFGVNGTPLKLFPQDAQFLEKDKLGKSGTTPQITAIVTESYLGPPQVQLPSFEEQDRIFRELENLHFNWLGKAHALLPKDGHLVMCAPVFDNDHLPNFNKIATENGFEITNSYVYDRPDQIVKREIFVLKKV